MRNIMKRKIFFRYLILNEVPTIYNLFLFSFYFHFYSYFRTFFSLVSCFFFYFGISTILLLFVNVIYPHCNKMTLLQSIICKSLSNKSMRLYNIFYWFWILYCPLKPRESERNNSLWAVIPCAGNDGQAAVLWSLMEC